MGSTNGLSLEVQGGSAEYGRVGVLRLHGGKVLHKDAVGYQGGYPFCMCLVTILF